MFVAGTRFTEVISSLTFGSIATRVSFLRKKKIKQIEQDCACLDSRFEFKSGLTPFLSFFTAQK